MGMFDYINYECQCPVCHTKVSGFQSKDGDCMMDEIEPTKVNHFYSICKKCGCWIAFNAKKSTNFTRTVSGKENKIMHEYTKDIKI